MLPIPGGVITPQHEHFSLVLKSETGVDTEILFPPISSLNYFQPRLFYPWVMYLLTVGIAEAFGLSKPSLFSNYKVMLLLCCLRVNSLQNVTIRKSCGAYPVTDWLLIIMHYKYITFCWGNAWA